MTGMIYVKGDNDKYVLDPVKVEEARHTQECQPAEDDPAGNWGAVTNGLQASIRFSKKLYGTNEPVVASVISRNLSAETRYLSFAFGLQSAVALHDPAGRLLDRKDWESTNTFDGKVQRMAQRIIWRTLEPGAQIKLDVDLRQWFEIGALGDYVIHTLLPAPRLKGIRTNDTLISGDATFRVIPAEQEKFPVELSLHPTTKDGHYAAKQPVEIVLTLRNISEDNLTLSETDPLRDFRFTVSSVYGLIYPKTFPLLDKEMSRTNMVTLKPGESRDFKLDLARIYDFHDFPLSIEYTVTTKRVVWKGGAEIGEAESSPVRLSVER